MPKKRKRWLFVFQLGSNWSDREVSTLKEAKKEARKHVSRTDIHTHAEVRATDYWNEKSGENRSWQFSNVNGKVEELEM